MASGDNHPTGQPPALGPPSPRVQLLEVLVFLFLIVPSMVTSFFIGGMDNLNFSAIAVVIGIRDLSLLALVCYFIWRNEESWPQLGWEMQKPGGEILLGLLLFPPVFFGANFLEEGLQRLGLSAAAASTPSFLAIHGSADALLGFVLLVIVAVSEETIFRGYLIRRFQGAGSGHLGAAFLSAALFSLGHGYEGTSGVLAVGTLGLALALIYLWRGSLVASTTIHFLVDFSGILLPYLLK